jgi:segregation and condensation protein B
MFSFEEERDEAARAEAEAKLREALRITEALLFAATEPTDEAEIARRLPDATDVAAVMARLREDYAHRGINLVRVGRKWLFRTAADLGWILSRERSDEKKLSRAALETLAIVAYHQPVTRAEIEDIRGVAISKGTLDVLLETGWVRLRGRRRAPGRPITYGTTEHFLLHFGLEQIGDLPGLEELKGAGLFDGRLPAGFGIPQPSDALELREDEDPLEADAEEEPRLEMHEQEREEPPETPEDDESESEESDAERD